MVSNRRQAVRLRYTQKALAVQPMRPTKAITIRRRHGRSVRGRSVRGRDGVAAMSGVGIAAGSSGRHHALSTRSRQGRLRGIIDFNHNPVAAPGDPRFDLGRMDSDVRAFLATAVAVQAVPIDRLRHMNPLAIELCRRYKVDIATAPLTFAVNRPHLNGGIAVDFWGRTTLAGCYAVGEAAGSHGVTRPAVPP